MHNIYACVAMCEILDTLLVSWNAIPLECSLYQHQQSTKWDSFVDAFPTIAQSQPFCSVRRRRDVAQEKFSRSMPGNLKAKWRFPSTSHNDDSI